MVHDNESVRNDFLPHFSFMPSGFMHFFPHHFLCDSCVCSFCLHTNKMSQEIEIKSKSGELCSSPKGAEEQRYSLIHLRYFVPCTHSGPGPSLPVSQWHWQARSSLSLTVSWAGRWSHWQRRPVFSYSLTTTMQERLCGVNVTLWLQQGLFSTTCFSCYLNWLMRLCLGTDTGWVTQMLGTPSLPSGRML